MKHTILAVLALSALAAGCDRTEKEEPESKAIPTAANSPAADNTDKNERDRNPETVTPGDQGENEADLNVTQRIRQDVIADEALSMTAKNVKIITMEGVVTLRGPVDSDKERSQIAAIAQRAPGVKRVDNQLEVAAK
jgi:hyperosmotically inducible periplasmic protein